jgi:hypothetical protein
VVYTKSKEQLLTSEHEASSVNQLILNARRS